ncbi:MAG: hypothetical protein CM1200mP25_4990 [Acidobacteriota bacterium]|nr:MAG: hypothetical protein CM1200mP25_4990 [Acidobacteriota bacterium]
MAFMPAGDVSINVMSLFAFILVWALWLMTRSLSVKTFTDTKKNTGINRTCAGQSKAHKKLPNQSSLLFPTTVAAFLPLMFVPGMMGKIFRVIPLIVIPCLIFSLVESLGILPPHLSHTPTPRKPGLWRRFQSLFSNGLKTFIRAVYEPMLARAVRWRYLTAAVGVSTLVLTVGMVLGGWTTFRFFPSIEADFMAASITMPLGARFK